MWTLINVSKLEQEMNAIDRAPAIITINSKEQETTPNNYFPGGITNIALYRCFPPLEKNKITKGRLGNWIAFPLQNEQKQLEIMTIYRLLSTLSNRV